MNYKPTGNVDDFYEQQDAPALAPIVPREEEPKVEEPDEEKESSPTDNQSQQQTSSSTEPSKEEPKEEKKNNAAQEIGTAVVGAGIDFVESVGETAQRTIEGKWFDWDWEPTWLQVDDKVEPMNTTVWGKILRGGLEFGLGFAMTGGAAQAANAGLKATRITAGIGAAATKANTLIKGTKVGEKVLKAGKAAGKAGTFVVGKDKGAVKGAVYDFVSTQNNEEALHDQILDAFPWMPDVASYDDNDSPLENRLKNVMEGLAFGRAIDKLFSYRAGKKAAQRVEAGTDTADPKAVAAGKSAEIQAEQAEAVKESIQLDIELDPGLKQPTPNIHPDMFDAPAQGNRTRPERSAYKAMKDILTMANRGDLSAGRRANLLTQANMDRIAKTGEVRAHLDSIKLQLEDGFELPAGQNVGGLEVDMIGINNLGLSKYFDISTTFPDLRKANFDDIAEMLLEDGIVTTAVDGTTSVKMNAANVLAYEMLMTDAGQAVSDLSTALASVGANAPMDMKLAMDKLMNNLESLFLFGHESSEFAGSLLRARRGDVITPVQRMAARDKKQQIKEFVKNLRQTVKESPEAATAFMRAFAESNGDVATLEALRRYAKDQVNPGFWASLIGSKKSLLIDEMFTTLYNSILSSPKTLARAFSGTNLLTVLRPLEIALGGALSGDIRQIKKGGAMAMGMFEGISEAWALSKNTRQSLIKNTPGPYAPQMRSAADDANWKGLGVILEQEGNTAGLAQWRFTNALLQFNQHWAVAYPRHTMSQIDAFSKTIIARGELRARAFDKVFDASNGVVDQKLVLEAENSLRDTIFNNQGEAVDVAVQLAGKEAALQLPLTGRLAQTNNFLNSVPILKPFFLFMKTGVNALEVVRKHTPLLARYNDEVNAILKATPENMSSVAMYGITDATQLASAKALVQGRVATGMLTVGSAVGVYTSGRLSGNGPADPETRRSWQANGWKPRSIKLGDRWINYDGMEPFASFLALVADIGDNSTNLGELGTENMLQKLGYMLSQNLTNKSYLSGVTDLNEILAFNPDRSAVWAGNLVNNFIPWGAARNDLANLLNPGLRELENDFVGTIMNRNPLARGFIPLKYDPLNGEVVKEWDFATRLLNTISPFQVSGADTETRKLLRDSGFDLTNTFKTDQFGNKLTPEQASKLQEFMGKYNIEKDLEKLYNNPGIKKEIEFYRSLREKGIPGVSKEDPRNTPFNKSRVYTLTQQIFNNAKRKAMQQLYQLYPELRTQANQRKAREGAQQSGQDRLVELLIPTR
jgi:hypothetical protein